MTPIEQALEAYTAYYLRVSDPNALVIESVDLWNAYHQSAMRLPEEERRLAILAVREWRQNKASKDRQRKRVTA